MPWLLLGVGALAVVGLFVWTRGRGAPDTTLEQPFDAEAARRRAAQYRAAEEAGLLRAGAGDAVEAGIADERVVIPIVSGPGSYALEPVSFTATGEIVSALDAPILLRSFFGRLAGWTENEEDGEYVQITSIDLLGMLVVFDDQPSEGGRAQRVTTERFLRELAAFAGTNVESLTLSRLRQAMRDHPSAGFARGSTQYDSDTWFGPMYLTSRGTGSPGPVKGFAAPQAGELLETSSADSRNWAQAFVERYRRVELEVSEARRRRAETAATYDRGAPARIDSVTGRLQVSNPGVVVVRDSSAPRLGAAPGETAGTVRR